MGHHVGEGVASIDLNAISLSANFLPTPFHLERIPAEERHHFGKRELFTLRKDVGFSEFNRFFQNLFLLQLWIYRYFLFTVVCCEHFKILNSKYPRLSNLKICPFFCEGHF